ncbi:MAG: hypothetical protein HC880_02670 [Bacteroidia bacterium]|nr:hypothetical protein [Bacteroidia bacterium]
MVHYDSPQDTSGVLYNRISLTAVNTDEAPEQLQITLDVQNIQDLVGEYTLTYTEQGGIEEATWIGSAITDNFYPIYSLCDLSVQDARITVERQQTQERIITGTFEFVLCERTDPNNILIIRRGEFRDIKYVLPDDEEND